MTNEIKEAISQSVKLKSRILNDEAILQIVAEAADIITRALKSGNRVLFCGNGGSAADAQHLAAELSGRFYLERKALNAEAINLNIPFLTAVSNDYNFDYSYARYLEGAAKKGDVLVLLSTSGNSANVVKAAEYARNNEIITITLTGKTGGKLAPLSDISILIPSDDTPRIQEVHMLLGHCICERVEKNIFNGGE
jgi:D-sedoheptulose 7-phosphate isomerase